MAQKKQIEVDFKESEKLNKMLIFKRNELKRNIKNITVNGVNTNPFNYSGYNNALNKLIQYPNIGITSNLTSKLYNNINNVDFFKLTEYSKTYDAKSSFNRKGFNVGNFYWENYWRKQQIKDYSGLML